jgi:hypothetical protein
MAYLILFAKTINRDQNRDQSPRLINRTGTWKARKLLKVWRDKLAGGLGIEPR